MKIIFGLCNPGEKYQDTRHNVGFWFLDILAAHWNFPAFENQSKFQAEISKGKFKEEDILLAKPQTFMNLSGKTVRVLLDFYKLSPDDIIVIHDELDLPIGKYRVATDSQSAGHNGVQNIIDTLGTQKFNRLRIGIGQGETEIEEPACKIGAHDFVLGKLTNPERKTLESIKDNLINEIEKVI
jgi:peptidyl-tRNA hydrolase, PTH1 family